MRVYKSWEFEVVGVVGFERWELYHNPSVTAAIGLCEALLIVDCPVLVLDDTVL